MFLGLAANTIMGPLVGKFSEHGFIAIIVMYMWMLLSMQTRAKPGPPASVS